MASDLALLPSPIGIEVLDDPGADPVLVRRMLGEIATANRLFGGVRALHRGLRTLFDAPDRGRSVSLLDIGTGAGDLPHAASRWATAHGLHLAAFGLERHPTAARLATTAGIPTLLGCGGTLPLRSASIDVVLLSQLLHHLDDTGATRMLAEAHRVARRGVLVLDLRPSRLAALGFRAAATAMGFHRSTIDDGVVSLARGRTAAALADLARSAGARAPHAVALPFARVLVSWRTDR
ncbi:MAG: methyltransferase domain-containing protein [Gemmatimonadetes bacterium]|nr:methyltransferase domain-containing protein [Gemmatimonadota bacterium]